MIEKVDLGVEIKEFIKIEQKNTKLKMELFAITHHFVSCQKSTGQW